MTDCKKCGGRGHDGRVACECVSESVSEIVWPPIDDAAISRQDIIRSVRFDFDRLADRVDEIERNQFIGGLCTGFVIGACAAFIFMVWITR